MKKSTFEKLANLGYRVTDTKEFLGLSDDEMALIDLKHSLIDTLIEKRRQKGLTQAALARLIGSSQPRIAMLERGRPQISLDLICRALFALGITRRELGKAILSAKAA